MNDRLARMIKRYPYGVTQRPPTTEERRAARVLSRELERATLPTVTATRTLRDVPPGRLNMRGAVEFQRQLAAGEAPTAKPWEGVDRRVTHVAPLRVGILADVSGSMALAQRTVASMSWVVAEATRTIHGSCCTVLVGDTAYPAQSPGEHLKTVNEFTAYASFEAMKDACLMLDVAMDMIDTPGPRLLVVVSDGQFVRSVHKLYAASYLDECRRAGVAVVWVSPTRLQPGWGMFDEHVMLVKFPTALGAVGVIGKLAAKAVRESKRRA